MLADNKGQCIFNEEIFKLQNTESTKEPVTSGFSTNELITAIVIFIWAVIGLYDFF